ncbi:MAG: penicillin-binding transpeptidase domain-containing protein [Acutalibacteraceae bacterium]|nr:penicillin-binding transpeptidase domain-containing protein [Acutalibacteraceae bacterium]
MAIKPGKEMVTRIVVIMLAVIILFSGVSTFQLVNIMIVNGEKYQNEASEQQLYDSLVTAPRGEIYDRNMQVLARSTTAWTVYITPNGIHKIEDEADKEYVRKTIAENLSEILELEYDKVYEQTGKRSYYVIVKKKIEKSVADKVREFLSDEKYEDLELVKYVGLDETTKRYYPNDSLASVVLGFVGSDDQGLSGLESYYDNELTGIAGRVVAAKSAAGTDMPLTYEMVESAKKGNSLVLTIDSYIQYTAEKYLEAAIAENQIAERGAAVVMNVKTGAVLAMAVKGDFNPNDPFTLSATEQKQVAEITDEKEKEEKENELLNRQWRNKAVSDTYEPGSVFKIVTASIALEENLINEKSTFYCSGSTTVAGQHYNCHKRQGHGNQTLAQSVSNSCNPAFITIGQLIGVSTFSKYFKAFGLTEKTGIDLPGEANSTYHAEENMGPVELSSTSFGQTFNLTPMQLISAAAVCVNGGYLVKPHLVEKMIDEDGKVVKTTDTGYKRQVISEKTSATMRTLMEFVAEKGAKNALATGYRVGAKTGTSQKMSKILSTGDSYLYVGSCVSVAPIDDPEVAVLVILDEPKGDKYYGGVISAPVNGKIMTDILPYLGYEPSYSEEELKNLATSVPEVVGDTVENAKAKLSSVKLEYQVKGKGEKIVKQLPEAGNRILRGGVVILYTDDTDDQTVTVPNLVGLTANEVNTVAAQSGINIEFSGNTTSTGLKSYNQSVAAGTSVSAGTIVTVYFRDESAIDG